MENLGTNVDDIELAPITNDEATVLAGKPHDESVSNSSDKPPNATTDDGPNSFYYGILIGLLVGLVVFGISGGVAGYYIRKSHSDGTQLLVESVCPRPDTAVVATAGLRDSLVNCLQYALVDGDQEEVVLPQDSTYFNASQVFSKFYQNFPVAVVFVTQEQSIANVMICARQYGVSVNPRCGGHGNAGQSVQTGEITLDLSRMRDVALSPDMTTFTVGAGHTAGSASYALWVMSEQTKGIPIGQKPTVGISGLALGGGFGFSTRFAGFLCDNIVTLRAVTTNGTILEANETANTELLWSSCGGGGGSFAVVTQFTFRTIEFNFTTNLTVFHYPISMTDTVTAAQAMVAFQDFSYAMSYRATPNLEVIDNTLMEITGYYYGNKSDFYDSLALADPNNYFPASQWIVDDMSYIDAVISLSGWKSVTSPSSLLGQFYEERNYFQFKSFLLFSPLTHPTALQMLLDFVNINGTAGVLFEFQTLGGENSTFTKVAPEDTAFAHRHTRHCMMLKSWGATRAEGDYMFGLMTNLTYALSEYIPREGAYVNHLDYELWDYQRSYYGLYNTSHPADWDRTINRLIAVNQEYDGNNIMRGLQLF